MAVPQKLINIACLEFPSRKSAIAEFGTDEFVYALLPEIRVVDLNFPVQASLPEVRHFRLTELPSGWWAYMAQHPNDQAVVQEWNQTARLLKIWGIRFGW